MGSGTEAAPSLGNQRLLIMYVVREDYEPWEWRMFQKDTRSDRYRRTRRRRTCRLFCYAIGGVDEWRGSDNSCAPCHSFELAGIPAAPGERRSRKRRSFRAVRDGEKGQYSDGAVLPHSADRLVYDEVLAEAKFWGANLIIVGSHSPSMSTYLFGSNAQKIVRHANCSVMVVRPHKDERGTYWLVPPIVS